MSKVILSGYIIVPDNDLVSVKQALEKHAQLTLEEAGCLVFEVVKDASDPNRFTVYEEFIDQAAFEHHQARVRVSHWGEVTMNVERHYKCKIISD